MFSAVQCSIWLIWFHFVLFCFVFFFFENRNICFHRRNLLGQGSWNFPATVKLFLGLRVLKHQEVHLLISRKWKWKWMNNSPCVPQWALQPLLITVKSTRMKTNPVECAPGILQKTWNLSWQQRITGQHVTMMRSTLKRSQCPNKQMASWMNILSKRRWCQKMELLSLKMMDMVERRHHHTNLMMTMLISKPNRNSHIGRIVIRPAMLCLVKNLKVFWRI